ncbi:hypothetical protein NDU88_009080 [Pleurodeles waltl]|uniref:Uncharacterized protein n=1 Tax=Pleurodeles waltl TaxID=8319 RepID=A0AAV7QQI1_PLEWA|nr:hypothetical protein NDU88_009080 [Pleurodeles waltl]
MQDFITILLSLVLIPAAGGTRRAARRPVQQEPGFGVLRTERASPPLRYMVNLFQDLQPEGRRAKKHTPLGQKADIVRSLVAKSVDRKKKLSVVKKKACAIRLDNVFLGSVVNSLRHIRYAAFDFITGRGVLGPQNPEHGMRANILAAGHTVRTTAWRRHPATFVAFPGA